MGIAVEVRLEDDAFVGDLTETGKAEDLIAAGIGENRTGPVHEAVQPAERADQFMAGTQEEMVGVGEDNAGAQFLAQIALREAFDGALRTDRHKDGRRDVAMIGVDDTGAGAGNGAFGEEFELDPARQPRLYWRGATASLQSDHLARKMAVA